MPPRRLILRSFQSPGDIVMLTAAVRDLHLAHKGQFETDVRTSADALWLNNPHITRLSEGQPGVETIQMHYPLIHESNQRPYHFIHGYPQYLEQQLELKIPVTRFHGDIHLSRDEKDSAPPCVELGIPEHFWIIVAGGKHDFTAKWWNPASYQQVVDHFKGRIQFVQCGESGHWHPPMDGVINLVGKTDTRAFIRLMYHADGVVCPVTFAMHLAAAIETKSGRARHRPCVVIAGGREPPHWEAYPQQRFLSTVGELSCCADGGCWKSRCQTVGDGDMKDRQDLCVDPVQIQPNLRIPRCMELIGPEQVIDCIERDHRGGLLKISANGTGRREAQPKAVTSMHETTNPPEGGTSTLFNPRPEATALADASPAIPDFPLRAPHSPPTLARFNPFDAHTAMNILINFRHGLGDAVQLTIVLKHLQKYRPTWSVDVAALIGKHSAYRGLCRKTYVLDRESPPCCNYSQRFSLDWHECHSSFADTPGTKAERCLREVFGITPDPELCRYTIAVSDESRRLARAYLEKICGASRSVIRGGNGQNGIAPVPPTNHAPKSLNGDATASAAEGPFPTGHTAEPTQAQPIPIPGTADARFPVVLIHYEGNTSGDMKNIPVEIVRRLCDDIIAEGFVPVVLDWDSRSPLPDGVRIHCPDVRAELWQRTGTGDTESLAALIDVSYLMVGVDSGPLHVAGATSTPTLGVWTRHHPLHYFALAENVTHLVPRTHHNLIRGEQAVGATYFDAHYQYLVYDDLEISLRSALRGRLHSVTASRPYLASVTDQHAEPHSEESLLFTRNFWIRPDMAEQDLVVVQDIAEQDSYRVDQMPMPRPVVVDVGAHIGCFSKRLYERNPSANIFAVECCPENIPALQKNVGRFATVVQGAITYEPEVALLNAVYRNCRSTGGSTVVSREELHRQVAATSPPRTNGQSTGGTLPGDRPTSSNDPFTRFEPKGWPEDVARAARRTASRRSSVVQLGEYWADFRPLRTLTLEDLMRQYGFDHIDILKLDCEGSEFSILGNTPSLGHIGLIVGEYHGEARFKELVADRFEGWELKILNSGELGTFWLVNPRTAAKSALQRNEYVSIPGSSP